MKTYEQSKGKVSGWDIVEMSDKVYFEVKWDTKSSAKWKSFGKEMNPTGNLFIEYVNPTAEKDIWNPCVHIKVLGVRCQVRTEGFGR